MSKSGDKALQAQEAEAQSEAEANPYSFTAPPDSPRAVLEDGTLSARVGVEDLIGEAQALVDGLVRLREDMDRFSGRHVPDPLVLRSEHLRARLGQLVDALSLVSATYAVMHSRIRPF
jgi:hypothetical protein